MTPPVMIVGLGNPGDEYRGTRHNAGAMVVDRFAASRCSGWRKERKFFSELATGDCGGRKVVCVKPLTYMNLSGEAVAAVSRFYRITSDQILVVADDADLPLGAIRMRPSGGAGGHNGLASVIQHLGSGSSRYCIACVGSFFSRRASALERGSAIGGQTDAVLA